MISAELILSFFAASMSTIIGCLLAFIFRTRNIIILMVYWVSLVFAFTFLCLLQTFVNGEIKYHINLIAPIFMSFVIFPGSADQEKSKAIDYMIAGVGAACIATLLGFYSGEIIIALIGYGFFQDDAIKLTVLNSVVYLSISMVLLKKYRKLKRE